MYEDEKIRAAGDLSMRKEGIGVDLFRSLYRMRNGIDLVEQFHERVDYCVGNVRL